VRVEKMEFHNPQYFILNKNLELEEVDEKIAKKKFGIKKNRVIEESLETFFLLFYKDIINIKELQLFMRPRIGTWGGADLYFVDRLKRVHIAEIKKKRLTVNSASQLIRYNQNNVFKDINKFIDESKKITSHFTVEKLAMYIAGLYTNKRTSTIGFNTLKKLKGDKLKEIQSLFGHKKFNASQFNKLDEKTKDIIKTKYLLQRNKYIGYEFVFEKAKEYYQKVTKNNIRNFPFVSEKTTVLWLIGPEMDNKLLEFIKEKRKNEVDIRVALIDMRTIGNYQWIVKIIREKYDKRDKIEQELYKKAEEFSTILKESEIKLKLYNETPASQNSKVGGDNLEDPYVIFNNNKYTQRNISELKLEI